MIRTFSSPASARYTVARLTPRMSAISSGVLGFLRLRSSFACSICCRVSFRFGPGRTPCAGCLHPGACPFDNQAAFKLG